MRENVHSKTKSELNELLMREAEIDVKKLLGKSTPSKAEIAERFQELLIEEEIALQGGVI